MKKSFLLQFHITEACNLRCSHCYQDNYKKDLHGLSDWLNIINQYVSLCNKLNSNGRIHITGGEPFSPFIISDLYKLLDYIEQYTTFNFGIMTNGTLITKKIAKRLSQYSNINFIQVSIDGNEETHNNIRGAGQFQLALNGLKMLSDVGINTSVSMTAMNSNWQQFNEVYSIISEYNASMIWTDRVNPMGQGDTTEVMDPNTVKQYFHMMTHCEIPMKLHPTEISFSRALQFNEKGSSVYTCTAGESFLTIMSDGTLYPCRRMPIPCGNVYETPLIELFESHPELIKLRNHLSEKHKTKGCESCSDNKSCGGGLKCLSYNLSGDYTRADPGCWRAQPLANTLGDPAPAASPQLIASPIRWTAKPLTNTLGEP